MSEPFSIDDYRNAPGNGGPLAFDWKDKPHRVLWNLCEKAESLQRQLAEAQAQNERMREALRAASKCLAELYPSEPFATEHAEEYYAVNIVLHKIYAALPPPAATFGRANRKRVRSVNEISTPIIPADHPPAHCPNCALGDAPEDTHVLGTVEHPEEGAQGE